MNELIVIDAGVRQRAAIIDGSRVVVAIVFVTQLDERTIASSTAQVGDLWEGEGIFTKPLPTEDEYTVALQAMLDAEAATRRYDGILSAASYANSTNPRFQAEGQACLAWRDAVWCLSYEIMSDVKAGVIAQPTLDELLAMMPAMAWPS